MPSGICAVCGMYLSTGDLCPHHHIYYNDDWARSNRIWCGYFHRGEEIPRLSEADRDDEFWRNLVPEDL